MTTVDIRDAANFSDYEQCVALQKEVWHFSDADVVPAAELATIHHYGGVCIGAFDREKMIGFVCGLVGREHGRVFHHSHMLAVLPGYRGRGLGEKLKWAQRDRVLSQGLDFINWTYDPLQAPNANLNINRLGVVIHTYLVNVYGESWSPLHGGIPTDRFESDWWLNSSRVKEAAQGKRVERRGWETLARVNRAREDERGLLHCEEIDLDRNAGELLVEIPAAITSIMAANRELALDWRLKTRGIFQVLFHRGYVIEGFHRAEGRAYYRLEKRPAESH